VDAAARRQVLDKLPAHRATSVPAIEASPQDWHRFFAMEGARYRSVPESGQNQEPGQILGRRR
jgi:hypothetical protein